MDIEAAAKELGVSVRHLRRLINSNQIPAQKVKMKKVIKVTAWEIPDDVVKAANASLNEMVKYDNFGEWMTDTADRLGLTMQQLSQRTKLPIATLEEVARTPGHLSGSNVEIEERIGKVLLRADIEKRRNASNK